MTVERLRAELASLKRLRDAAVASGNLDLAIAAGWSMIRINLELIELQMLALNQR